MQRDKDLGVDFRSDDEGKKKKKESPRHYQHTHTHTMCLFAFKRAPFASSPAFHWERKLLGLHNRI